MGYHISIWTHWWFLNLNANICWQTILVLRAQIDTTPSFYSRVEWIFMNKVQLPLTKKATDYVNELGILQPHSAIHDCLFDLSGVLANSLISLMRTYKAYRQWRWWTYIPWVCWGGHWWRSWCGGVIHKLHWYCIWKANGWAPPKNEQDSSVMDLASKIEPIKHDDAFDDTSPYQLSRIIPKRQSIQIK